MVLYSRESIRFSLMRSKMVEIWNSLYLKSSVHVNVPVADPDRCHGLQETYENCQPKFNTICKFVLGKNNEQGDDSIFRRGDWLFASCDQLR